MYIALNGALPYDGKTVEKVLELFLIKLQMFCLLYTSRPLVTPGFTALVEEVVLHEVDYYSRKTPDEPYTSVPSKSFLNNSSSWY